MDALIWFGLTLGQILIVTVAVLLSVAFLILFERKVFAGIQMRKGPNVVGRSACSSPLPTWASS